MLEISKCDTSIISVSISKKLMIDIIKTFVNNEVLLKEYEQEIDCFIRSISNNKNLNNFAMSSELLTFLEDKVKLYFLLNRLKWCENEDEDNFYHHLINHMLIVYEELKEDKPIQKIHTWLKLNPKQIDSFNPIDDYNAKYNSILCKFSLKQYQKYTNRAKTSQEGWTYQISVLYLLIIDRVYWIIKDEISIEDFLFKCFTTLNPIIVGFQTQTTLSLKEVNAIEVLYELYQLRPLGNYLQIHILKDKSMIEFVFTSKKGTFSHFEKPFEQNAFNSDRYVKLAISGKGKELYLKSDIIGNSTFEDITGMACKKAFYSLITDETTLEVISYRVLLRMLSHTIQYSKASTLACNKLNGLYQTSKEKSFVTGNKIDKEFEIKNILKKNYMEKNLFNNLELETYYKTALMLIKTFELKKYELDYVIIAIELAKLSPEEVSKRLINIGTKQQALIRKMIGFIKQQDVISAKTLNILYKKVSWS